MVLDRHACRLRSTPRLRRSRSGVTSHSAAPAAAHSRNLSSSGSRLRRIRREGVTSLARRRSRETSAARRLATGPAPPAVSVGAIRGRVQQSEAVEAARLQ
jgi:hypothetical protein